MLEELFVMALWAVNYIHLPPHGYIFFRSIYLRKEDFDSWSTFRAAIICMTRAPEALCPHLADCSGAYGRLAEETYYLIDSRIYHFLLYALRNYVKRTDLSLPRLYSN